MQTVTSQPSIGTLVATFSRLILSNALIFRLRSLKNVETSLLMILNALTPFTAVCVK